MSFETLNNAFVFFLRYFFVLPFFFLFELILFIPSFLPSLFFFVSFFLAKKNRSLLRFCVSRRRQKKREV